MTETGAYHYLCTRNNNFSNRQQKGRILVVDGGIDEFEVGKRGGVFASADGVAAISVPKDVLKTVVKLRLRTTRTSVALSAENPALAGSIPFPAMSGFETLTPADLRVDDAPEPMTMTIRLDAVSTTGDLGGKIPQAMRDEIEAEMATKRV